MSKPKLTIKLKCKHEGGVPDWTGPAGETFGFAIDTVPGDLDWDLEEMARYVTAWIAAHVLEEPELLHRRAFVESLDLTRLDFDPDDWRQLSEASRGSTESYSWSLDPEAMRPFRPAAPAALRALSA